MSKGLILGANGQPADIEAMNKTTEQNAMDQAIKRAAQEQWLLEWERYCTTDTFETACDTMKGQLLVKGGLDEAGQLKVYNACKSIYAGTADVPQKNQHVATCCETLMAIISGIPEVINNPLFSATIAAVESGLVASQPPEMIEE